MMPRLVISTVLALLTMGSAFAGDVPRAEHPRPDRVREHWTTLNGAWQFAFDDGDAGLKENWQSGETSLPDSITVPFAYQAPLSGIGTNDIHHVIWYKRMFDVPEEMNGKRIILHFNAVDYETRVWLNGREIGSHTGGHVPFSFDITGNAKPEGNVLVVRVFDSEDRGQPRGKQYWMKEPAGVWYTRTSGIWQPVWLEAVGDTYIRDFRITPKIDAHAIDVEVDVDGNEQDWQLLLRATNRATGESFRRRVEPNVDRATVQLSSDIALWSPEKPNLYDLELELRAENGAGRLDVVQSYFGMRKIEAANGQLYLNNEPYYQKLVLDQGYWPESIMTPPSDEAMKFDIEMTKAFGFNGCRKHQKVEDPRWLYWADHMGLLVWGEMAAQHGRFEQRFAEPFIREWSAAVRRDYNRPCIVIWTPFNETWGIEDAHVDPPVQRFVERVYQVTKYFDPYRPICDNSGWDHVLTDVADYHDYAATGEELIARFRGLQESNYSRTQNGLFMFFVEGKSYNGQPIVLSEFGGIGLANLMEEVEGVEGKVWSYGGAEADVESFLARYRGQIEAIYSIDEIVGFCYTQLTDLEQEANGLLTYDRKIKIEPELIAEINDLKPARR